MASSPIRNIFGLERAELRELALGNGQAAFRGDQVFDWIYPKGARDFNEMSNLPLSFREDLRRAWEIAPPPIHNVEQSLDGTKKYLYALKPGVFVESAYIPEEDRKTLCLSTQGGCKMACLFCMTGRQGLQSQLNAGEIVGQLAQIPERNEISHLVYMGMGEPLDNVEEVIKSIRLLEEGYCLGPKRITVSTIGILPGLKRLLDETEVNLALSLHSPFPAERKRLMPVESVYPIYEVIDFLKTRDFSRRKLSFEYIMFDGVNDSPAHAKELLRLLNPLRCRINLLHFHPIPHSPLKGSPRSRMEEFQKTLKDKGMIVTIRKSRGEDIQAACGLLSTKELVKRQEVLEY